jgi:LPS sulfotransferase NodH
VSAPPLFVLGVRRSGTTLLRVMLDRHSALAVPDESYFIPQLTDRHRGKVDVDAFVDDIRRLPTLREWGVDVDAVRSRLRVGMSAGEAIGAVYEAYAAQQGKTRWGDKTPMYMQHLPAIDRLFPHALYVHLIRDGRDAAVSFLQMPEGVVTPTWAHPQTVPDFACQWRAEIVAARALGRRAGWRYLEVRYEELVSDAEATLHRICDHVALDYEPAMLDYTRDIDVSERPHQQSLRRPPTAGLRDWRSELTTNEIHAFESVAGDVLADLGYAVTAGPTATGRLRRIAYASRVAAWNATGRAVRVSPLWRRRHPLLTR